MKVTHIALLSLITTLSACDSSDSADFYDQAPLLTASESEATANGWEVCYTDLYDNDATTTVTDIMSQNCFKNKVMLACRPVGDDAFTVAAWAPRADALFDTGFNNITTVNTVGTVSWYFNEDESWGFIAEGDSIDKNTCDTEDGTSPESRLCWHVENDLLSGGYRCGATKSLNSDAGWQRVILHK